MSTLTIMLLAVGFLAFLINILVVWYCYKVMMVVSFYSLWRTSWVYLMIAVFTIVIHRLLDFLGLLTSNGHVDFPDWVDTLIAIHPLSSLIIALFLLLFILHISKVFDVFKDTDIHKESKFITLLKNLPAGVVIYGQKRSIVYANSKAQEVLGFKESLEGKYDSDLNKRLRFTDEHGLPLMPEAFPVNEVLLTGKAFHHHIYGVYVDGVQKWFLCNAYPVKNGESQVVSVFFEITDLREAQEACKASEDLYRNAFMHTHDAVVITDMVTGQIFSINKSFTEITGYGPEIIGKTTIELGLWKDQEDRDFWKTELQAKGYVKDFDTYFLGKEGKEDREIHGLLSATVLIDNGGHVLTSVKKVCDGLRRRKEDRLKEES